MNSLSNSPNTPSQHNFSRADLEQCADGMLFGMGNAQLPSSPLLMLDRIVDIQTTGGHFNRGFAAAELDIHQSSWFFKHHFRGDPVMPGCFLIESLWQLTGFHMAWSGYKGAGRIIESGRTRFFEPVHDVNRTLQISVDIRKVLVSENPVCIANGEIRCEEVVVCKSDAIKVCLVSDIS